MLKLFWIVLALLMFGCGGQTLDEDNRIRTLALTGFSETERQAFDEAAARVTRQTAWSFPVKLVGEGDLHDVLAVNEAGEAVPSREVVFFEPKSRRILLSTSTLYDSGGSYESLVLMIESVLYRWREEEIIWRAYRRD